MEGPDQQWLKTEKITVASDTSKSTLGKDRILELIHSIVEDTTILKERCDHFYSQYANSDLDSCSLRLKQNIDQLKKIKNSLIED